MEGLRLAGRLHLPQYLEVAAHHAGKYERVLVKQLFRFGDDQTYSLESARSTGQTTWPKVL